jgi:hypothetical protein
VHETAASRWFVAYSLTLAIIALSGPLALTILGPRLGPVDSG